MPPSALKTGIARQQSAQNAFRVEPERQHQGRPTAARTVLEPARHLLERHVPPWKPAELEVPDSPGPTRRKSTPEPSDLHQRLCSLSAELASACEKPLDAGDHFPDGREDPLARPAYALAAVIEFLEEVLPEPEERRLDPLVQLINWLSDVGDGRSVAAFDSRTRQRAQR